MALVRKVARIVHSCHIAVLQQRDFFDDWKPLKFSSPFVIELESTCSTIEN